MPPSDTVLFDKWRANRDADAFAELLSRHAGMVYGACLRVLKNPGMAEEVAQECFLDLTKGPRGVRCVGAWLHTVATRRALDRLKAEGRRSERERRYAAAQNTAAETDWDDTREFVDEAIAALPEELRVPIVLRFLEGRTHEAIAEELAVARSTVRSRLEKGIGAVRENLARRGVIVPAGAFLATLESLPAAAAPPALLADLGRRALAMHSGATLLSAAAGAKYALAPVALAALVLGGAWVTSGRGDAPEGTPAVADGAVMAALAAPEPSPPPQVPVATPEGANSAGADELDESETVPVEEEEEKRAIGWVLDLTPSENVLQAMQKIIRIEFRDTHIKDILEFIQKTHDVTIVLDSRVVAPEPKPGDDQMIGFSRRYITDGHIRHIDQRGKTLEETLAVLTTMLNLTYKVRGDAIWISSSARITRDLTVPLPSAPFREGEILESISKPVNIEFERIHLSDVLRFVVDSYGVPIVVDDRVVIPRQEHGEEPPPVLTTHVTDGIIDYINMKDTSLAEMLFTLTRLLDLTYRIDKDAVYISTPDRVRGRF